ncbi:ETC complex I subunit region [Trichuris suis]|nr:ETC complex I subunit region [Trichuris suis]
MLPVNFRVGAASVARLRTFPNERQVSGKEDAQQTSLASFVEPRMPAPSVGITETSIDAPSQISGVPEEHQKQRRVRIFMPAKVATQAGTDNTDVWKIEVDNQQRWESLLTGWCSNADPLSNIAMALNFHTAEAAAQFCERIGWPYEIVEPQTSKTFLKSYGANFSWDKRTRVLNENSQLINTMIDCQSRGKLQEAEKQELASNGGHPEFLAKLQVLIVDTSDWVAPFEGVGSESDLSSTIPLNAKPESHQMGRYMQHELQSPLNEVKLVKKPDHCTLLPVQVRTHLTLMLQMSN